MECVASRMRGSVECGPVTAYPLATVSATKRGALLRAIASLAGRASASSHNAARRRSICSLFLPSRSVSRIRRLIPRREAATIAISRETKEPIVSISSFRIALCIIRSLLAKIRYLKLNDFISVQMIPVDYKKSRRYFISR